MEQGGVEGADQLLQTETTEVPQESHHHHHHHHQHYHDQAGAADTAVGDETLAQTLGTGLEIDDTQMGITEEAPDQSELSLVLPLGQFMFCDSLKKSKMGKSFLVRSDEMKLPLQSANIQFSATNNQAFTHGHIPGHVTVTSLFHMESNRENKGPDDDGLDDSDLTAADGIVRVKKERPARKQAQPTDNLKTQKGEFTFPHRTYKPKCQIAHRVPPGEVPQAVMAERLHRMYKKTDINIVLQTLGIELSDLIPPPNYGENNERFYQEMMYRNRIKINGVDKREALVLAGRFKHHDLDIDDELEEEMHKPVGDSSLSVSSSSLSGGSEVEGSTGSSATDKNDWEDEDGKKKSADIHPFIVSKPPFNPQFPLSYFDNSEYDIRTGEDWCRLGWDEKEKQYYPLPAKAFIPLPLPHDKISKMTAPSEKTIEEILRKTPRLEKFRSWLLRERFQRQIRLVGLDPSKVAKLTASEMEMTIVARLGSTVQSVASELDDSFEEIHKVAQRLSERRSKQRSGIGFSEDRMSQEGEKEQEDVGDSDSDRDLKAIVDAGKDEDHLNIVYKLRQPRRDDDLSDEDDKALVTNDDAKRSVSILSDLFSDMDSLTMLDSNMNLPALTNVAHVEETDAEEYDEEAVMQQVDGKGKRIPKGYMRPARSYFMGDYGIHVPTSPDVDPYEDGMDQFVIDYEKMKKVHIHDWRWVEVAVFDYHPGQNKYFVRTIFPPVVYAWVSKVYICFDAEDPNKHGQRIKDAVIRRFEMENWLRYNLYVDCLPMIEFPNLEEDVVNNIVRRAVAASRTKFHEGALIRIKREVNLEWQRTIAEEKFQLLAIKHHKTFMPWVQIPDKSESLINTILETVSFPKQNKAEMILPAEMQNFEFKVKIIQKNSVIFAEEAWKPYSEITNICQNAKNKDIILTRLLPMHLDDWEQLQMDNIEEVKYFMREEWYENVVANLKTNFAKSNKSWYNLSESNYDVFLMSKLSNFLQLVKIMMQDTIRSIVLTSCVNLTQQIKEFSSNIDTETDWSWGEDLINSEFPPPEGVHPIWSLEMYMDPILGPRYSQPLSSFYRIAYRIFTSSIRSCADMPTLLLKVMPQMQFAALGFLKGIEENEKEVMDLAQNLVKFTKLILLPLESYIGKFAKYKDVWSMDIANFIKTLEASNPTALDIKRLVEQNKRHMERLEKEIPSEIKITAFKVIVEHVREGILKKKRTMISSILDNYAYKLRKIIQKVQKDYQEMEKKLTFRSDDIEEVMELKGYVEIVPSLVARLDNITNAAIKDYEVFDHFMYQVSNEDVNAKWSCALASNRILRLGREATKWLDEDYDRLLKGQQADLSSLSDQVDSATLTVAGLAAFTELEKAKDVCEEIKKIWKTIKDLQEQSALINRRQKIFGLPLAQHEALSRLTRDIEPFKNLWFTASDWLTVQETLNSGSLEKVEIDQLTKVISEGGKVIGRCIKYFAGADQIQHIAKSIKHQLEEFKPLVPLVQTLKKSELRQRHWQTISDVCGFVVVERAGQNFKKLLEQGIQNHVKEIKEIGDLATKEFEVENALDKMVMGMSQHRIIITYNKEYKMQFITVNPATLKIISDYILVTNALLKNPYREPFNEKLIPWEKKIKSSKSSLALWVQIQDKWFHMQHHFAAPDAPTKMPVTFKMYEKMQRVWRRVIRLARDTKEILDLLSNNTTVASLNQFEHQLALIQQSLEEQLRPKGSDESDDD